MIIRKFPFFLEKKAITKILDRTLGSGPLYIGAQKTNGSWGWQDGSSWDYSNWFLKGKQINRWKA